MLYKYTGYRLCHTSVSHKNSGSPTPRIPLFAPATNESMLPKSTTSQRYASLIHASGSRNEDQRYEQCTNKEIKRYKFRQSPFPRERAMLSNRQPRTSLLDVKMFELGNNVKASSPALQPCPIILSSSDSRSLLASEKQIKTHEGSCLTLPARTAKSFPSEDWWRSNLLFSSDMSPCLIEASCAKIFNNQH